MSTSSLLEAIHVAKENERRASDSYADAANTIKNPMGKELFKQLSEFEQFHYEKIAALERSMEEQGSFIDYEGKEFPLPPLFIIKAAEEPNQKSLMKIIAEAIDLEQYSEKAYSDLAALVTDPQGHEMFRKLAEEEHIHYRILSEAYWTLNNLGVWKWSRT
jgi:rubrerythrin